jgi:DNA polymerase-3 subunit alpha
MRADRIAEAPRGQKVRLGGILTGLTTVKTRRGKLMARAVLEDLGGTVDTVFFPDVFDRSAELLRGDGPLLLEGALQPDSERAELLVSEVVPLEDAYGQCTRTLYVDVSESQTTGQRLEQCRAALDLAPGETPVFLRVTLPSRARVSLELRRHRVSVTSELVAELERIFGGESITCSA